MKKLLLSVSLSVLFIFVFTADIIPKNFTESQEKTVAENLTAGLNSENLGIRISSAQRIFEFIQYEGFNEENFSSTIIPLMKMLREGNSELERISAALSLYKLEDARGMYLLKRYSEFDKSEKVRMVEKNLYNNYVSRNRTSF